MCCEALPGTSPRPPPNRRRLLHQGDRGILPTNSQALPGGCGNPVCPRSWTAGAQSAVNELEVRVLTARDCHKDLLPGQHSELTGGGNPWAWDSSRETFSSQPSLYNPTKDSPSPVLTRQSRRKTFSFLNIICENLTISCYLFEI